MASVIALFRDRTSRTFNSSFQWFDRSYIADWTIASAAWVIAWIIKGLPPFEREFSTDDPLISHKHHKNQISGDMTWSLALFVPMVFFFLFGILKGSAIDIHHSFLGLWTARGFNGLITEALKNRVGRLRPDFLSRCKWKNSAEACTGKLDDILDGRRSFPSGHSSTVFCGMTFLALWLAATTGAFAFSRAAQPRSFLGSRLARQCFTLSPIAFATWVAVSRLEDYRHHKEDVIVGSLIGIFTALTAYLVYWPNPFLSRSPDVDRPRLLYREVDLDTSMRNNEGYELAGMDHTAEAV